MFRPLLLPLALSSFVALTSAFAAASAVSATTASSAAALNLPLRDTRWSLDALAGAPLGEVPARPHLVLASKSQHLSGHTGCNRVSGRYTQRGTQLALKPVATTRMACEPAPMDVEARLLQALAATDGYRIEGRVLSLLHGDEVLATFRAPERAGAKRR